jgi:hypothetical protein
VRPPAVFWRNTMGEAKKRSARLARFIEEYPWCCFCGGKTPAQSIDHQPAAIIFPDKQRPQGLEFPACNRCNWQTSADEALLGLVSRMAGSLRSDAQPDPNRVNDMVNTVDQAYPGLPRRMLGPRMVMRQGSEFVMAGSLDPADSQIDLSFRMMATKFSLAFYFHQTRTPAPVGTRVQTAWEHSQARGVFKTVETFLALFPMHADLRQGKWQTDDSFFIRYVYGEGQLITAAICHESIALLARLFEPPVPSGIEYDDLAMGPSPEFGIALIDASGRAREIRPASAER